MTYGEERRQAASAKGLSAARGILIGLGVAALLWGLLAALAIHLFN